MSATYVHGPTRFLYARASLARRASRRPLDQSRPGHPTLTPTTASQRPDKKLLAAWLLLLIDRGETHGYDMGRDLNAHGLKIEPSAVYRLLRTGERDGWMTSRWTRSVAGPQRRAYELTPQGVRQLNEIAGLMTLTRDAHDALLQAHQRAVRRRGDGGHEAGETSTPVDGDGSPRVSPPPKPAVRPLRPRKELMTAWLLLLLDGGATYGYDLGRELDAHRLNIDPAAMYRTLRKLEHAGWVQSRWMRPAAGPRRRFYRLTASGRRNLDEIAGLITAIRDVHDYFLQAYARTRPCDGADGSASPTSV